MVISKGVVRWNTNRDGGWHKYKEKTDKNMILNKVSVQPDRDPEKMMSEIEKELKNIKFEVFGKLSLQINVKKRKNLPVYTARKKLFC